MARKRLSQPPRKTILLVTASEIESLYFSQMRKDCRYSNMTVEHQPVFKDLHHLINLAARKRSAGGFTTVWLVFGLADLGLSAHDVRAELEHAEKKRVHLAWNNPGLPLWFYLHFQEPKAFVRDMGAINGALEKAIDGYSYTSEYFLNDGDNFHLRLYSAKSKAAVNGAMYNDRTRVEAGLEPTRMIALLNEITDICGLADLSRNQKQLGLKK
ncbi:MAG: RloB domain-containing protein [Sphaerochaeta sp.]|jgi:hypothetical protein